jgi:hypothetical protein
MGDDLGDSDDVLGVCRSVSVTSGKEAVGQLKVIYPEVRT